MYGLNLNPHPKLVLEQQRLRLDDRRRKGERRHLRHQAQPVGPGLHNHLLVMLGGGLVVLGRQLQERGQPARLRRPVEPV